MRKTFFILLTFLSTVLTTHATDGVSVSESTVSKGNAGTINIALDNDSYTFTAFSFKLTLPEGLSFITDSEGKPTFTPGDRYSDHGLGSNVSGQTATFTCFSINTKPITGTSGTILTINIQADATLEVGAELTATLSELTFSTTGAQEVNFDDQPFTVTITDSRVLLDENSTTMPEAATGVDVLVKRTIKANGWSTICLPFALSEDKVKSAFGNDVELADFVDTDTEIDAEDNVTGITVNFETATEILANHPYLIRVSEPVSEFTVDNVNIEADEDGACIENDNGKTGNRRIVYSGFYGTYHADTVVPKFCLFIADNQFWYSMGNTKMKAFRAYFEFYDVLTEVDEAYGINIHLNPVNGITDVHGGNSSGRKGIYNLQGIKVSDGGDKQGLPTGVYIENGKKVAIK